MADGEEDDLFGAHVLEALGAHVERLRRRTAERRQEMVMRPVNLTATSDTATATGAAAESDRWQTLGVRLPHELMAGDTNLRTLRTLLAEVDERGYERSAHQMQFHAAFERCTGRVIYKQDWSTSRPTIMHRNGWTRCSSEVLISTPRRFGKTFSIAIFAACMALSFGTEIVVFSPARRASRKMLERIVEFVRLLECDERMIEYNQGTRARTRRATRAVRTDRPTASPPQSSVESAPSTAVSRRFDPFRELP